MERFYQDVVRTDKQPRPNIHEEEAWKKYFNLEDVEESINNLVGTMLNPDGSQCWGFKEIRYGRKDEESHLKAMTLNFCHLFVRIQRLFFTQKESLRINLTQKCYVKTTKLG